RRLAGRSCASAARLVQPGTSTKRGPQRSPGRVFKKCSLTRPAISRCGMLINRSAPPATVTPVLVYEDVRAAVTWLESAFGFGERVRIGDGHRAPLRVGRE